VRDGKTTNFCGGNDPRERKIYESILLGGLAGPFCVVGSPACVDLDDGEKLAGVLCHG
jgi:hypothetical protein